MKRGEPIYYRAGEAAKRLGVSVRTLQYYDKIGLCVQGALSDGGRRLYSAREIVRLHQILSLKYLGFSLEEIKDKLFGLESPAEVVHALGVQEEAIAAQIESLREVQKSLTVLKSEVKRTNAVDWERYAELIGFLRGKDDRYWFVALFSESTIRRASDRYDAASAQRFQARIEGFWDRFIELEEAGEPPDGEKAQASAREFWDSVIEFSGGDLEIIQDLMRFSERADAWKDENWKEKFTRSQTYLNRAVAAYFKNNHIGIGGV